ncbi:hypothetical protein BKA67DRAFT_575651 [Truncatella angustata]|uniref:Uncharacterized protein n=1 Tax=Truncatella angustata TaxID=152316 RepID=A0A9P8ZVF8_9PEZI|nr:uncharacterized protein BKA67DRAFT_575651 [Truncatella angustata]KAH6648729.1 hypothetical protein BKA67DRAFT_575651 [Truncatella angustata]
MYIIHTLTKILFVHRIHHVRSVTKCEITLLTSLTRNSARPWLIGHNSGTEVAINRRVNGDFDCDTRA